MRRSISSMRFLLAAVLLLAGCAARGPLDVVQSYRDAMNKGEAAAMAAAFSDSATWNQMGMHFTTPQQMRDWLEYIAAIHFKEAGVTCALQEGQVVRCQGRYSDDCYLETTPTVDFRTEGAKITRVDFVPAMTSAQQRQDVEFAGWADANHPDEIQQVYSMFRSMNYNREGGEMLSRLCSEFNSRTK